MSLSENGLRDISGFVNEGKWWSKRDSETELEAPDYDMLDDAVKTLDQRLSNNYGGPSYREREERKAHIEAELSKMTVGELRDLRKRLNAEYNRGARTEGALRALAGIIDGMVR